MTPIPDPTAVAMRRGTVLLVEDHPGNTRTLVDYLSAKGFEVAVACDGKEALARCDEFAPAAILMDVQMPQMDGLSVTRVLRADPRFADTPIIALTALAMPGDRERCLAAGMTEYIAKPAKLGAIVAALERFMLPTPGSTDSESPS